MRIKPGVRVMGIRPEVVLGLQIINDVFRDAGEEVTITSVIEGKHSRGSLHYTGCAADIRRRNIPEQKLLKLVDFCRAHLGNDYDLVVEKTHLHLEFQPKEPYQ